MYITDMSKRYSVADARRNLPTLISEAEGGSDIELTRRGKSVAVLLSAHEYARLKGEQRSFKDAYADFLERFDPKEVGLEEDELRALREGADGRPVEL